MINIIHPKNVVTLFKASRTESAISIWRNFKKLILGESMNFGTDISYNIEHACIIEGKYLLLRGWSFARNSYTRTLISNCGFFLDKVPSMLPRPQLHQSNKLLTHINVGFMFFGEIEHNYDQYLKIELVSDIAVVELDIKLKKVDRLNELIDSIQDKEMEWISEILLTKA